MDEMGYLRQGTLAFIAAKPVVLQLIPRALITASDNGKILADQTPRAAQTFRMIPQVDGQPSQVDENGESNQYPFILLGAHDSIIAELDYWEDPIAEMRWQVSSLVHFNGYERKAMVTAYGERPR